MRPLDPGTLLYGHDSQQACVVGELLGEGGQGEVYRVTQGAESLALKWYNDLVLRIDKALPRRLQLAIDMGAPSNHFLWPRELVSDPAGKRLGYVMKLRAPGTVKVQSLLTQEVRPSFRVVAYAGWQLVDALFSLHAKGLAYQDLNAGNVFLDPHTGQVEVCDNDNVDIDGAPSVMGGVMEFQAPEVVLRHAGPSRASDLYSLAVMLFRMLHVGHPMLGQRELGEPNLTDPVVMRRLYASHALFVFDPADASNRPHPDRHGPVLGHWALYPKSLRDLFVRAFTSGLHDPAARVQESEWRRALRALHDSVQTCPVCSAQNFYDPARQPPLAEFPCWHCGHGLPAKPLRLGLRRATARPTDPPDHVIVAESGARLFADALDLGAHAAPSVAAEVIHDPLPSLVNRTAQVWTVQSGDATRTVGPQGVVPLTPGLRIDMGRVSAFVRA